MSPPTLYPLERCVERIAIADEKLGHSLGWRFLMDRQRTYTHETPYAFITMNPGGHADDPGKRASCEAGNAYWVESWRGEPAGTRPLQQQVQNLFREIVEIVGYQGSAQDFAETRVCSAVFVPFRSPDVGVLHQQERSLEFARRLWTDILAVWRPQVILTIGKDTFSTIQSILTKIGQPGSPRHFDTGWRQTQGKWATMMPFSFGDHALIKLAGLPHLSHFQLFSDTPKGVERRPKLRVFLREAFGG